MCPRPFPTWAGGVPTWIHVRSSRSTSAHIYSPPPRRLGKVRPELARVRPELARVRPYLARVRPELALARAERAPRPATATATTRDPRDSRFAFPSSIPECRQPERGYFWDRYSIIYSTHMHGAMPCCHSQHGHVAMRSRCPIATWACGDVGGIRKATWRSTCISMCRCAHMSVVHLRSILSMSTLSWHPAMCAPEMGT